MLDIELAKLPPPRRTRAPSAGNAHSGQSGCCRAMPVPIAGASSMRWSGRWCCGRPTDGSERRRDAHRRAGDAGDGGQREELSLGEGEAQVEHLHGDDPHMPQTAKPQSKRRHEIQRLR